MAGQTTSRATAFFYANDVQENFRSPGCNDLRDGLLLPVTHADNLDVGGVTVQSATASPLGLVRDSSGSEDFLGRPHGVWYKKVPNFSANDGDTYFPPDQTYDLTITPSGDLPQTYSAAAYMPAAFTPISPPATTNFVLPDNDVATTFTAGNLAQLPAGATHVVSSVLFTADQVDAAGVPLPLIECYDDVITNGSVPVPKSYVETIRSYGAGHMLRQMVAENFVQIAEGPGGTAPFKLLKVYAIWSYDTTWTAL
jgi:hypothetical protein